MTPEKRLELLEELERKEAARQKRAARAAWGSVGAAAVALAGLLVSLAAVQREVTRKQNELAQLQKQIQQAEASLKEAEARRKQAEETSQARLSVLSSLDKNQLKAAVDREITRNPQSARLLPRVYMQIVDPADRARASGLSARLQAAGYVVLGTELVPRAAGLKQTEVRYYRKAEEKGAAAILEVLQNAGVSPAKTVYLNLENNTQVRLNHFEVWLAPVRSGN